MCSVHAASINHAADAITRVAVIGSLLLLSACGGGDSTAPPTPPPPTATAVVVVSGANQHARITRTLSDPIVVLAQSAAGAAVSGASVTFAASGGLVDPASAITDGAGRATVRWTLGATAGVQTLTVQLASGAGTPVALTATADPALDAIVTALDGDGQQAIVGTPVFIPPTVRVTDRNGAPIADVRVRFSPNAGSTVAVAEPRSDADGRATTGSWTMGSTPGTPQVTVTIIDADVVSSSTPPTFVATAVAVGGVATAPRRTYAVNTGASTSIRDTVTGWRVEFPAGGHGTLSVARVVGGPDLPDAGATRATVNFSGSERVEMAVTRPPGGELDGYFYGQVFDAATNGRDSVRWWGLPLQSVRGDTVVFLIQPNTSSAARSAARSASMRVAALTPSVTVGARPSVQAYATAPIPAGSSTSTKRGELRLQTQRAIDWWLANLSVADAARLRTAMAERPYTLSAGATGDGYYWCSLFTGYVPTIYYNISLPDFPHAASHEVTHYVTHMLVGDARYNELLSYAATGFHDLGFVTNGFRRSLIEEYSHFADFSINGTLTKWDLRSLTPNLSVREMMGTTPTATDFPSLEGFGGAMLAALTRTGADTLVYDHYGPLSRSRAPALGVGIASLLGVLADGPRTPDELRIALQGLAGSEQALAAVLEPAGWSYNALGRLLDDRGLPVAGVEVASVVKVGSSEYTTGKRLTLADGRFFLPRLYPGTSRLRMYRAKTNGGLDSVDLGPYTVPWSTNTSQTITMADVRVATYGYTSLSVSIGDWIVMNSASPGQDWACPTTIGLNTSPWGPDIGPTLATLKFDGANFSASGSVPFVTDDWRATHTVSVHGTLRPGVGDTTWADIEGSYLGLVESLRYEFSSDPAPKWMITTDSRIQFRLHDVPLRKSGDVISGYLRQSVATSVFTSGSLYYMHNDWSHPEYRAVCQTTAIDPTKFMVNVYFN
ncbi:MAG: Ig-like domain-containing protein [Gemmatimonadaceae bacterium]|nr:Ig-like domain-containing protein [Gemmatimonadaceae bacterium]